MKWVDFMAKEVKTNAMRILDRAKIEYEINLYDCDEFIDAVHVADMLSQPYESSYKTLVASGKNGGYFVFVLPIAEELDMKAAAVACGQKSVSLIPVREITAVTGYIRGGCSPVGMKKKYPTFFDESCILWDSIAVSAGERGHQMVLPPDDLIKITDATLSDIIV